MSSPEVKTEAVSSTAKIFVTPIGKKPVNWILDELQEGVGFKIILDTETTEPIKFNWWIVEEE